MPQMYLFICFICLFIYSSLNMFSVSVSQTH